MPARLRSGSCGPSAARGAASAHQCCRVAAPSSSTTSYFLGSFGKLLTPPTTPGSAEPIVTSLSSEHRVKAISSRDRKCVTARRELLLTPPPSRSEQQSCGKSVKSVRFETVQDDNRANELLLADLTINVGEEAVMEIAEPLYATVRKRSNPSEQSLQRQVDMPQPPREQGFRPYRSLRQNNSNSALRQQHAEHHRHAANNSSRQPHHQQQHTWHVRQNTEIWSSGYKVQQTTVMRRISARLAVGRQNGKIIC